MKIPTIKELMHEQARFVRYRDGKLWYQVGWLEGGAYSGGKPHLFDFPIDVHGEDAGGDFGSSEKSITLMRWIRKHIEYLNNIDAEERAEKAAGGEW